MVGENGNFFEKIKNKNKKASNTDTATVKSQNLVSSGNAEPRLR